MSAFFIQEITIGIKLTYTECLGTKLIQLKLLGTKLKYGVKDNDQIRSLPFKEILCVKILIEGLLMVVFMTNFLQVQFGQAQLPFSLNSYIIIYFILLYVAQACATYKELRERVWRA